MNQSYAYRPLGFFLGSLIIASIALFTATYASYHISLSSEQFSFAKLAPDQVLEGKNARRHILVALACSRIFY